MENYKIEQCKKIENLIEDDVKIKNLMNGYEKYILTFRMII